MENAPVIILSGLTHTAELEEKYSFWFQNAFAPLYVKMPGRTGLDTYKILRPSTGLPVELSIYYHTAYNGDDKKYAITISQGADDIVRDSQATFKETQYFWNHLYALMGDFRPGQNGSNTRRDIAVNGAGVIRIEGYRLPASIRGVYENWFNVLAGRIYIPLLLRVPGVVAMDFFRLVDHHPLGLGDVQYIETDMPPFISVTHFNNLESLEGYHRSIEYAAFQRSLEVELAGGLKTIWNADYRLCASHRP